MQESGMLNAHVRMNGSALQQGHFRVLNVDNGPLTSTLGGDNSIDKSEAGRRHPNTFRPTTGVAMQEQESLYCSSQR